jgi:hypothetical protein
VTGVGACLSYSNATVPFGPGSSRGNVSVTVPRGCLGGTRLTFLPSLRFTNGLTVPGGHVLRSSLTLVGLNGSTAMVRLAQIYLQQVGGTNRIITGTAILVRNGVILTAQTSSGTVASANVYGVGFRLQLNHFATVSRVTFSLDLVTYLDDGGVVRTLDQQRATMLVVY